MRTGPAIRILMFGGLLVAFATVTGCQQSLDPQEYGQIIYELPKIKGAEKRPPLPELDELKNTPPEESK